MPKRKCKWCKEYVSEFITPPAGVFCNMDHAISFAQCKAKKKAKANENKKKKAQAKVRRIEKESIKTKAKWLAELQALVNKYVRLRDANEGCISCDKEFNWQGQWHASHYHPRGRASFIRFNLWNVHKSCSVCNNHMSGNLTAYKPRILNKIGQERYDWLESNQNKKADYSVEWIKRAIKITKRGVKRITKRNIID